MAKVSEQVAASPLVSGGQTTLHSHAGDGGGPTVKSGVVVDAPQGESVSVTFGTAFALVPQVVLTMQDATIGATNARVVVRSVTTTGFTFEIYRAGTVAWIATDAGNA